MDDTPKTYNFFKKGEYSTTVLHPWWEGDPEPPESKRHLIHWRVQPLYLLKREAKDPLDLRKKKRKDSQSAL